MKGRTLLYSLIMIVLGVASGAAVGEVGLRLAGWPTPGLYVDGRGPLPFVSPGAAGGAYPPSVNGRLRHYDYDVPWRTNEHGFRERPLTPKREREWRIGVLGDSFAAGTGVEETERFDVLWGEAVRGAYEARGWEATLWNFGAPMAGTAHQAAVLAGVGAEYELDEIVLAFYAGNDLDDNAAASGSSRAVAPRGETASGRAWLREHSRLATFLWVNGLRAFASFEPPGIYDEEMVAVQWPATEQALERVRHLAGGRPLTIWYLPAAPEWDDGVWADVMRRYGVPAANRHLVRQRLSAWATSNGVPLVDTTGALTRCPTAGECMFPVDAHWNATGHRLVGEHLVEMTRAARSSRGALVRSPVSTHNNR